MARAEKLGFKGNKSFLPSKTCVVCGKEMTWRKSWAKNWDEVKFCSDACRSKKSTININATTATNTAATTTGKKK